LVYGGMRKGRLMDRVRVIRVLEYEGTREWVEELLKTRCVHGYLKMGKGGVIREAILGDFPEIVEEEKEKPLWERLTADEYKFMKRFSWEFLGQGGQAVKRDPQTGKVLAHEGDETWTRDLKVAGE